MDEALDLTHEMLDGSAFKALQRTGLLWLGMQIDALRPVIRWVRSAVIPDTTFVLARTTGLDCIAAKALASSGNANEILTLELDYLPNEFAGEVNLDALR